MPELPMKKGTKLLTPNLQTHTPDFEWEGAWLTPCGRDGLGGVTEGRSPSPLPGSQSPRLFWEQAEAESLISVLIFGSGKILKLSQYLSCTL